MDAKEIILQGSSQKKKVGGGGGLRSKHICGFSDQILPQKGGPPLSRFD